MFKLLWGDKRSDQAMEIFQVLFLFVVLSRTSIGTENGFFHDETDKQALLSLKENLNDSYSILSSWNHSIHYCKWIGVTCSHKHPNRVFALDLPSSGLVGPISSSIGNLTFLRRVDLSSNALHGEIPLSIGHLRRLKNLNLGSNSLEGEVPTYLYNCTELLAVNLSYNQFVGEIPLWIGSLNQLEILDFSNNNFAGVIPASLTNLSSLNEVYLSNNYLEGPIPSDLAQLTQLQYLNLAMNNLSGTIPRGLYNLTSLSHVALAINEISGRLPVDMGTNLHNLQILYLDHNLFCGPIPASLSNATMMDEVDLSFNNFSGAIPSKLGNLCPTFLNLYSNELETKVIEDWKFLQLLTNCSRLEYLVLGENNLTGIIPSFIGNLTKQLQMLILEANYLSGAIPSGIENLDKLTLLALSYNLLQGKVPQGIGKLQNLHDLSLSDNRLSGSIPSSLGNLSNLIILWANDNYLEGFIPSCIGNLTQLDTLYLYNNRLIGTLPKSIFKLPSLSVGLDLSNNYLVGNIPIEVGNLTKLTSLILSRNNFSGEIPETITNCQSMEKLTLDGNLFYGRIPSFLSNLKGLEMLNLTNNNFSGAIPQELGYINGLQELYLAHNNLSGNIPETLENLSHLIKLDISYNDIEGRVPTTGVFQNITGINILGNKKLCGGIPRLFLPNCPRHDNNKPSRKVFKIAILISSIILFLALFFIFLLVIYRRVKSRKESKPSSFQNDKYPKISYAELVKATESFANSNLTGAGRYGSVYKGILALKNEGNSIEESHVVAIKVFNLQLLGSSRSFLVECEALSRIRHRNLIHVITCCSTIDYRGNDFKALILDYMPNGSLDGWLYRKIDENGQLNTLSLIQRLNIAIDAANALDYLHNNCEPPLIHCDLKPSNILLNEDMSACVGDFGLAKYLIDPASKSSIDSQSSIGIRGSIGYIPPEYGAGGAVSTWGDVYSFGIVLLEMFTGKSPTDEMFNNGLTLSTYVQMAFSERVMYIIDPTLIIPDHENPSIIQDCLASVIRIGLYCSKQSPTERMCMKDAATEMHKIRKIYLGIRNSS